MPRLCAAERAWVYERDGFIEVRQPSNACSGELEDAEAEARRRGLLGVRACMVSTMEIVEILKQRGYKPAGLVHFEKRH